MPKESPNKLKTLVAAYDAAQSNLSEARQTCERVSDRLHDLRNKLIVAEQEYRDAVGAHQQEQIDRALCGAGKAAKPLPSSERRDKLRREVEYHTAALAKARGDVAKTEHAAEQARQRVAEALAEEEEAKIAPALDRFTAEVLEPYTMAQAQLAGRRARAGWAYRRAMIDRDPYGWRIVTGDADRRKAALNAADEWFQAKLQEFR